MDRGAIANFFLISIFCLPGLRCVETVDAPPYMDNTIPAGVSDFLSDAQITELESIGLKIYKGGNPPQIEGRYSLNELNVYYDDQDINYVIADYFYTFSNQTSEGEIAIGYEAPLASDSASNLAAYLSGVANCFSIYVDINGTDEGCNYRQTSIISGCITDAGIKNWQNGLIWGQKRGATCDELIDEGHKRIINENDGLAEAL